MGLESFFITLLPPNIEPVLIDGNISFSGESHITINSFIEKISNHYSLKQIKEKEWYWFIVKDVIVMRIEYRDKWFNAVSLEGCFSYYEENLQICYDIAQTIKNLIFDVTVYHPSGLSFRLGSKEEFFSLIKDIYQDKYQLFLKHFGEFKIKVTPERFYEALSKIKRKR